MMLIILQAENNFADKLPFVEANQAFWKVGWLK